MIYVARAKPETDRKGIDKTRGLDKYLWACLRPSAVRRHASLGSRPSRRFRDDEESPLLEDSHTLRTISDAVESEVSSTTISSDGDEDLRRCVEGVLERQ